MNRLMKLIACILVLAILFSVNSLTISATTSAQNSVDETAAVNEVEKDVAQTGEGAIITDVVVQGVNLEYTGVEQNAVTVTGTLDTDTVNYKLDEGEYSTIIPTVKDLGSYSVTVQVMRDGYDVFEQTVTTTVVEAELQLDVSEYVGEYDQKPHNAIVINSGIQEGDVVTYKLGDGEISAEVPTVTNVGEYSVTVYVDTDRYGYKDFEKTYTGIKITAIDITGYDVKAYTGVYDGNTHNAVSVEKTDDVLDNDIIEYQLGDGEWSTEVPQISAVGSYTINVRITREGTNYNPIALSATATISLVPQSVSFKNYTAGGTSTVLLSTGTCDFSAGEKGDAITYSIKSLSSHADASAIATIDANGIVALKGVGCVEVKATKAASGVYSECSVTHTLVITPSTTLSFAKTDVDYLFGTNAGTVSTEKALKNADDTGVITYSMEKSKEYGVEIEKETGKVTISDYKKLSAMLDEGDVKLTVNASKTVGTEEVTTTTTNKVAGKNTVYFSDNKNWGTVKVYYWGGSVEAEWPGETMTYHFTNEFKEKVYKYDIPEDSTGIIFTNGSEQTVDIKAIGHSVGYYPTEKIGKNWDTGSYAVNSTGTTTTTVTRYAEGFASYSVNISRIALPDEDCTYTGETVNDWYVGTVTVTPPQGYEIAISLDDEFDTNVEFSNQGTAKRYVYLRRTSDGAITPLKEITLKIDSEKPDLNKMKVEYKREIEDIWFEVLTLGFYKAEVQVRITIDDENTIDENGNALESGLKQINWYYTKEDKASDTITVEDQGILTPQLVDGKYVATLTLSAQEAKQYRGYLSFTATDNVDNVSDKYDDKSNIIVVDNIAPTIEVTYSEEICEFESKYYYDENGVTATFDITEANFYKDDVKVTITNNGKEYTDATTTWDGNVGTLELKAEGEYIIKVEYTDRSGNEMDTYESAPIVIDASAEMSYENKTAVKGETNGKKYFNEDIVYSFTVKDVNFFEEDFKLVVKKNGSDYTPEVVWSTDKEEPIVHIATFTLSEEGEYEITANYTDKSGNKALEKDHESGVLVLDKTAPVVRVIYSDNTPVNTLKDSDDNDRQYFDDTQVATITITERNFNGADITIASEDVSGTPVDGTFTQTEWDSDGDIHTKTITYNGDANYTFDISCTDLAKNDSVEYEADYFTVDKTAPENLTIAYSKSVLDTVFETISFGFYQSKAKVTITAVDDTSPINEFIYSYTKASGVSRVNAELLNQAVSEAKITYSDDNKTASATFSIPKGVLTNNTQFNGTVGFTAKDRAGNDTDKKDNKRIVVDNIVPVCEVTYNQHVNEDGGVYYFDGNINASVKITEANFYSGDVVVSVTKDGASYPVSPSWTDESVDVHIGTFTLSQDGDYEITVSYTDKSGNAMTTYESNQLTIDTQIEEPTYSINGVAKTNEGGAYKKNATVAFSFSDENYNTNTIKLTRTRFNKVEDVTSKFINVALNANGGSGSFSIPTTVENDGIYVLSIGMTDKALHSTQSQIKFTINRYGSVYEYDDNLTALIKDGGQYVTSVQNDLVITEYNAERILKDSLNILVTRDGEAIDVDYTSTPEKIDSKVKIGSSGWYQYVYTIKASNFDKDGVYKISVASAYAATDSAKNESSSVPENSIDNEGNQILDSMSFVVDSTAPEIRNVVNLDEAIVNAQSLDVKYTIVDVGGLKCVEVIVNGEVVDTITEFGESAFNYSGQFKINEQTGAQTVQLRVTDLAGNVTDTAAENFSTGDMYVFNDTITVSTNFFVRWYANKLLFWGSIAGVIILAAAVWFIISKRKKN